MASKKLTSLKRGERGHQAQRPPAGNAPILSGPTPTPEPSPRAPTNRKPPVIPGKGTPTARAKVDQVTRRIAFAVLAGEHPTVFAVQCPWCHEEHVHYPGQDLVQHCPTISNAKANAKYAVMVPLNQLPERER